MAIFANIAGTDTTPSVAFDPVERRLSLEGESYPENAFRFFRPIIEWARAHCASDGLTLDLRIVYMNTSSVRCVMDLLDVLEDAFARGRVVKVVWRHRSTDERARRMGEEFVEDLTVPSEIVSEP
ncbi:MAG: DUF1987 domain-containing protein [Myxococcales bacterium]|nr:DUF1987 domain-containing protein [Myxococcales bacterium]